MRNINYERFKYQTTIKKYKDFIKTKADDYNWNYVDKYKETALNAAICNRNIEFIKFLLNKSVNINGDRKANYYPLEIACLNGNIEIIKILLSSSSIVLDREDDQSFIFASMTNNYEIVEYLINKGIKINKFLEERAALHWAVQEKNIEVINILLKHKADINILANPNAETPLNIAIGEGYLDIVNLLLQNNADPDFQTPLITATLWNFIEIAKILIKYNANVNACDEYGRTALFYAKLRKRCNFEKLFLDNGAELNIVDIKGNKIEDLENEEKRKLVFIDWYYPDDECEYEILN